MGDIMTGLCTSCHERLATTYWTEGTIAAVHGFVEAICEVCAIDRQLEHAKKMAESIHRLEQELVLLRMRPKLTPEEIDKLSKLPYTTSSGGTITMTTVDLTNDYNKG
jgi:protein-arginine kinase activator protein McsA